MRELPLHLLRGVIRNHYFVDSAGRKYLVEHPRISGLDIVRIKEVGVVTSVVSALLSGFNVPVVIAFDLQSQGAVRVDGDYRGKTREELIAIAGAIAKGHPYNFDEIEIRSVIAYAERVLAVPTKRLVVDGLRWLLPPALALVAVFLALFWKR
jgi:hypothetical protein